MNATAKTFLIAVFAVASAAVSALMLAGSATATAPQQDVAQSERVVIVGKRLAPEAQQLAHVEQLPRVMIEGRRQSVSTDTLVAQAGCTAVERC